MVSQSGRDVDRSEAERHVREIMGRCNREREALGWSVSDLAQASDIPRPMVSQYLGNVVWPTTVNLVRLTHALGLNLDGTPRQTPLD
jgi:transcriptional regulator with XRE-family HTH domain